MKNLRLKLARGKILDPRGGLAEAIGVTTPDHRSAVEAGKYNPVP